MQSEPPEPGKNFTPLAIDGMGIPTALTGKSLAWLDIVGEFVPGLGITAGQRATSHYLRVLELFFLPLDAFLSSRDSVRC